MASVSPDPALNRGASRVNRISIIVPMLNEAEHVEHFVADVAAQDFDGEIELLVADGGSEERRVGKECS